MPWQYEFARLNLTYTVMSKRLLKRLVEEARVSGWDDPRMPTVAGMRRRGYTPAAIRRFAERIGVSRRDSVVDVGLLEHALREDGDRGVHKHCAERRVHPAAATLWRPHWLRVHHGRCPSGTGSGGHGRRPKMCSFGASEIWGRASTR